MRIKGSFFKATYKYKLILSFSMIILTSILIIGLFNYIQTSQIIREEIEKSNNKILREVNLNLERYFNQYEQIFFNIATSSEYKRWLSAAKDDKLNTSLSYRDILDRYINPIISTYPEIITISFLNENGNENTYFLKPGVVHKQGYSISGDSKIKGVPLANKTFIVTEKSERYDNIDTPEDLYTMRLIRKFVYSGNAAGFIEIDVSMQPIMEILDEMKYSQQGEGLILNENGLIIAHTDPSKISSSFDQKLFYSSIQNKDNGLIFDKKNNKMIIFRTIKNIQWKSVAVIPYNVVSEGISKLWTITMVVVCLSIVLCIFMVIIISGSLTKRIENLHKALNQTSANHFQNSVNIKGNDEISELACAYNNMLTQINDNIHELADTKLLQQEAVLSALQSQINSHFLYNTLEIINSMAYIAGHKDIRKVVVALSKMLRYTSNYRDTVVTISEEIEHLKDYMEIMKIQMDDNLQYEIDMEENIENVFCLKAIIQPIVENSIKHGFEATGYPGLIKVKVGYLGSDYVRITITDNGKGFSEEKLKEVNSQLSDFKHSNVRAISRVGLINVNYRLKVFYSEYNETGVFIENVYKRRGINVQIIFPLKRKEEALNV